MWFRNLQIYRLSVPFTLTAEALHEQLSAKPGRICASHELWCEGWESPLGRDGQMLTHAIGSCIMICARREERLLPATVINQHLNERVADIEEREVRKVRRHERNELKDTLILELTPKALTRSRLTFAYIDVAGGWLLVDAASSKRAEELVSLMRETLGSFKVQPLVVEKSPPATMTAWLSGKVRAPAGMEFGDECELRDPSEEGAIVRCRRQDLTGEEIGTHLQAGKQVVRMSLEWQERIGFVLTEELALKRLKFLELIQHEADESEAEDAAARFDVDFALMSLELGRLIPDLTALFGGIAEQA